MSAQQAIAPAVSKFGFCDLALEAALQLERARSGVDWDVAPLRNLADVLSRTSHPAGHAVPAAFIESSYYQPFQRLLSSENVEEAESVDAIRAYFSGAVERLRGVEPGAAADERLSDLVKFCVGLHRELIRELKSEDGFGVHEWRVSDIPA